MKFVRLILSSIVVLTLSSCAATKDMSCNSNWLLFGPLAMTNCNQADGDSFVQITELPQGHSVIYIYRPYSSISGASEPDVYVNGKIYGELKNRGYLPIVTNVDSLDITIDKDGILNNWDVPGKTVTIKTTPGESYFLRVEPVILSMYTVGTAVVAEKELKMVLLDESSAIKELSDTRLIKITP